MYLLYGTVSVWLCNVMLGYVGLCIVMCGYLGLGMAMYDYV